MKLYCIRHGETVFNASRRIQGQSDSQLSELGKRQCQAVAEALSREPFDAVISSPLVRARDSAQCIAERLGLPLQFEPRLMELNAGIFQGHAWDELETHFPEETRRWRSQDPDYRIPGGESRRDLMLRAGEAFGAIREAGYRQAIVVAHGGSLSAGFKALLDIPPGRNPFELGNASISVLHWEKDVKLHVLNQTFHLHGLLSGDGEM